MKVVGKIFAPMPVHFMNFKMGEFLETFFKMTLETQNKASKAGKANKSGKQANKQSKAKQIKTEQSKASKAIGIQ